MDPAPHAAPTPAGPATDIDMAGTTTPDRSPPAASSAPNGIASGKPDRPASPPAPPAAAPALGPAEKDTQRGQQDDEAAMLLLSFGAPHEEPSSVKDMRPESAAPSSGELPRIPNGAEGPQREAQREAPLAESSASGARAAAEGFPARMPPPPSGNPLLPASNLNDARPPYPSATLPSTRPYDPSEPARSVAFAAPAIPNGVAAPPRPVQPVMGRFDVKPPGNVDASRDPRAEWARQQALVNGAAPPAAMPNGTTEGPGKPAASAQAQAQRKRKRSTSTSNAPGSPMPLAPLAIPALEAAASVPTPNPFVQPNLPHFMGFNNQTYRCICGTSVEPDKGTSTQCEMCLAWQHAECFGLSEEDLEGVSNYFCHLCRPRIIQRNEVYIADLVAMEAATQALLEAGVVDPLTPVGAAATRGGKRSRGGAKARARGREPSVTATVPNGAAAGPMETPATPANRAQLALAVEETPGGSDLQASAPSTAARGRKKPAQSRPARAKAQAAASRGAASPSAGSGTGAASPEPSYREGTAGPAASGFPQTPAAPPAVHVEPGQGSLSLRILEYTPTNKNIPRGIKVRQVLSEFLAEWVNRSEADPAEDPSAAGETATADVSVEAADPSDETGRKVSGDQGRRRKHLSPAWTSDPDFAALGPPAPPVILQGASLAALASRVEVREEREEATSLPASSDPVLSGTESRLENGYTRPTPLGVHTMKSAPEGTFFGEFRGEIFTSEQYQNDRINQYWELGMTKPQVHRLGPPLDLVIDARRYGNDLRFIRSGCHPNVVLRPLLHYDDNDENANVTLAFGIFASTRIAAGKELILGWEWDDNHVLHNLRAFAESAETYGGFPSRKHGIPPALQQKFTVVMSCIAGLFPSCACVERMDCALVQMQRLGAGLSLITGKDVKGKAKNKRAPTDRNVKIDLGPLVGACRSWRATSRARQSASTLRSRMKQHAEQVSTPSAASDGGENALSIALDPLDVSGQPSPAADRPASPEAMQVDSPAVDALADTADPTAAPVVELASPLLAPQAVQPAPFKSKSKSPPPPSPEKPEPLVVEPTPPADLELDAGEISDSSTLTEPLTHASDSEHEMDSPRKPSDVPTRSSMLPVRVEGGANGRRNDSYRKGRRVMSPTSPNLVSVFNSEDTESRFDDVLHADPPKRPATGHVVSPPPKKAKRNRIVSDATDKGIEAAVETAAPEPTMDDKPSRAAGMTPEMDIPPPDDKPSRANSPSQARGEEGPSTADQAKTSPQPVIPEPEPTVPEPAAPPKRRRIDLKRFAVSGNPASSTPSKAEGENALATPSTETPGQTPLGTPGDAAGQQRSGVEAPNGHYPWNVSSNGPADSVNGVAKMETPSDPSAPWWAKSAPARSFSLSGHLHAESERIAGGATDSAVPAAFAPPANGVVSPGQGERSAPTATSGTHQEASTYDQVSGTAGDLDSSRFSYPPVTPKDPARALPSIETNGHDQGDLRSSAATAEWSSVPGSVARRDDPPHVDSEREFYRDRAPSASRLPPSGPRSGWTDREDFDSASRDRDVKDFRKDERPDWEYRDSKDGREVREPPRGPRSDYRGRPPAGPFTSPGRTASSFSPGSASTRGSYAPRGGWGDGYRGGRGRGGGEPYRGRGGGFGRGRGSAGAGPGGYYQNARGRI